MFEKSKSVCFTTLATEKLLRKNLGFGFCDRAPESHLRLQQTLFKQPLSVNGEVLVVGRLGGETYLYVKIAGGETIIVQTDGDHPAQLHDYVPIYINGELCHLFA